jgi:hypothetical protein
VGSIESRSYEKYHYFGVYRLQAEELLHHQEQEDHAGKAGIEEVLQILPLAYNPPGD